MTNANIGKEDEYILLCGECDTENKIKKKELESLSFICISCRIRNTVDKTILVEIDRNIKTINRENNIIARVIAVVVFTLLLTILGYIKSYHINNETIYEFILKLIP